MSIRPIQPNKASYAQPVRLQPKPYQPRFGLNMASHMLQPTTWFQLISENFVWAFLAQDVIALWIPRIINALRRGRNPYDPAVDPAMEGRSPLYQLGHSLYKNTKGLNWKNSLEETLREVETGPGLFIAPSIVFGLGSALALGRLAVTMGYHDLQAYKNAFINTVRSSQLLHRNVPAGTLEKGLTYEFMKNMLHHGHFKAGIDKLLPTSFMKTSEVDQSLVQFLQKAYPQKSLSQVTFKDALNAWLGRWVRLTPQKGKLIDSQFVNKTNELEGLMKRLVFWFNESILKNAKHGYLRIPSLGKQAETTTEHFLENIQKFKPFIANTYALAQKNTGKNFGGSWASRMTNALISASEKVFKGVAIRKLFLGVSGTLLTGMTVVLISGIAQRSKAYPANRNVRLDQLNPHQQRHSGVPEFQGNTHQPLTPFLSRQFQQPANLSAAVSLFDTPLLPPWKGGRSS